VGRDLVEPEGVNAASVDALREDDGSGDPVAGGDAAAAAGQERPEPADDVLGAPPDPAENTDGVYGSEPPAG
jgi:hypothetical protein